VRWRLRQKIGPWISRVGWRWRIANWLNKSPKYCWCDLVDWVLKYKDVDPGEEQYLFWPAKNFSPLIATLFRRGRQDTRCSLAAAKQGGCYCLKFHTMQAERLHPHLNGKGFIVKEAS
jgi:hypothetical protein